MASPNLDAADNTEPNTSFGLPPVLPVSNPLLTDGLFSAGTTPASAQSRQSSPFEPIAVPHISNQSNLNPSNVPAAGNHAGPGMATTASDQTNQNSPTLTTLNLHLPHQVDSRSSSPSSDLLPDNPFRRYGQVEEQPIERSHFYEIDPESDKESYEEWKWKKWQWDNNFKLAVQPQDFSYEESPTKFKEQNPLCILSGDNEMIEVVVGEDASLWAIHKKLLCSQSSFFKAAIDSSYREGAEKRVVLKEDDDDAFSIFVQWLYTGSFTTMSLRILIRAFVLGDKLGVRNFQCLAFDKIYSMNVGCCRFTPEQVAWVAENTLPESTLRKFAVDTLAFGVFNNILELSSEDWCLLVSVHVEILQRVQSMCRSQPRLWQHKPRHHYNPII